ncbi:dipeptide epimerase [Haloarchaeobius amylolyticus]|uniref:dipeptide epimerase n=1 Tax=Haloarchaeobius amylolyticus TaxID=1198296 RepID=UPI00226D57D2|nr:dipeptide epimerase [Haloarchaeobius amylolyticus]
MNVAIERVSLPLAETFTISRGSQDEAENVVVRLSDGEHEGVGAAAPSRHYGETADTVEAVLSGLRPDLEAIDDPFRVAAIERDLREAIRGNPAARTAVSIALHDLVGKQTDLPLWRYWGLDPAAAPETSYTVGIADPETMGEKAARAADSGYGILKVKVGTDDDRARIAAVADAAPEATIRVDANEAWTPKEAVENAGWLADYDVEFVEQPVPAEDPEGLRYVYEHSPLPIAVDESCVDLADVPQVADRADVVVLKLMKCGGLVEAKRMIHTARAHGLEVMLGCMIESDAAISAGGQLAPLCDYVDLDGSLLLADDADPYDGPVRAGGTIDLDDQPGIGLR